MSTQDALSFLSAASPDYIAQLYARYARDPSSVDSSWADIFGMLGDDAKLLLADTGASWTPAPEKLAAVLSTAANEEKSSAPPAKKDAAKTGVTADAVADVRLALGLAALARGYRNYGHYAATLDPLGIQPSGTHPDLDPARYGITPADMSREVHAGGILGLEKAKLGDIVEKLKRIYSGTAALEYMHIEDAAERDWLQARFEKGHASKSFSREDKVKFLKRLTAAEGFERFLDTKFTGAKRFGVEGGEATIPAIEEIVNVCASMGLTECLIGIAHRGRLNVLTNVMGKTFTAMFSEFLGTSSKPEDVKGSGDVKYHMGASSDRDFNGNTVHLSLSPNPSHLEFVDPVVVGRVRAKQAMRNDNDTRESVMPILLHGDAALAGQGIVTETLMMSGLDGYKVGGTIHVVVNNQIGFTTAPRFSRSGAYCTDVGKMIYAPIFHVNGDDVEAVMFVARLAAEYRQTFKKDVFLDIICYRKHGHNEADEPAFTQPQMYKVIKAKKSTRDIYAAQLAAEGVLTQDESDKIYKELNDLFEKEFQAATSYKPNRADMLEGKWTGLRLAPDDDRRGETALSDDQMQKIGRALTTVPADFDINSKIARQLEAKKKMFETGEGFDWATAEALAFGALVADGFGVRLSGQDCGRGTFSHRHAALTDQQTERKYYPLQNIDAQQATFEVHDSPLSEAAVLGFEYGFSTADPKTLVLWEAQFGDFVNGAQVIIDQFIASAETKWLRMSGLVMLLPHGFEGQGPEHSSGRLERFLQGCAEDNWQVANCSTPANYFHILRRQMLRDFRKPLVLMTPKSLLRHKLCVSPMSAFTGKTTFHRVLPDDAPPSAAQHIKRVVICSGKIYYDLFEAREKAGVKDVILLRLEQFYPFPEKTLAQQLALYPQAEIVWCQEEPENQGGWNFVDRRIEEALATIKHKSGRPRYIGRPAAAAPATGSLKVHNKEQEALINAALTV
jgi:2-oxoglutarate dehydrogenase E1 component